ncbi:MAG: carbohydrate kinase [Clostridia bacterium]|nr:carbohydrate kinase [Clostridia bacterium]
MITALSFGEIQWDIYPDARYIGGAPFNFAAHLAKHGEEVYMLSAVGDDALGQEALTHLKKQNLHTDYVAIDSAKPSGNCTVSLDEQGVPTFCIARDVAWDYLTCRGVPSGMFDLLYFGTLALRTQQNTEELLALIQRGGFREIFADVNIRPPFYSADSIRTVMEKATIIKISDEELPVLLQEIGMTYTEEYASLCRGLVRQFPQINVLIITRGEKGACAYTAQDDRFYQTDAVKAVVVSTTGAGDSFSAAFIHTYLRGDTVQAALDYAAKVAAFVVSNPDAVPEYQPIP